MSARSFESACALACALLLGGCMVGPDYQRPAMDLPGAFTEPDVGAAPLHSDWWKLYNDPVLNELVAAALPDNCRFVTLSVGMVTFAYPPATVEELMRLFQRGEEA
jgi:hypothetical protein